jgi:hypothetical protein
LVFASLPESLCMQPFQWTHSTILDEESLKNIYQTWPVQCSSILFLQFARIDWVPKAKA